MKIKGNTNDVKRLKEELSASFRTINQSISHICSCWGNIEGTWKDSGYGEVKQVIKDMLILVIGCMDDIGEVASVLDRYAELLQAGEARANEGLSFAASSFKGPRELPYTQQQWREDREGRIFDSPIQTRESMDLDQGKAEGFSGTCGLVSCVNVLRLSGVDIKEDDVVSYASSFGLCSKGRGCSSQNGGTGAQDRQEILEHFGLKTELRACAIEAIAQYVEEGKGVIISIHAYRLWYGIRSAKDFHAVTVTSVKRGKDGRILGFYIADSGRHGKDGDGYYQAEKIQDALTGRDMNVTRSAIR